MKKSIFFLSAIAATTGAIAQSSVTLFGVVDAAVSQLRADGQESRLGLSSGSISASRIGFRGTEDLGAGLTAGFWLEGALQTDSGAPGGLTFQRRSTLSLQNPYGELRLGRDFAPSFLNVTQFDVFSTRGVGGFNGSSSFGYSDVRQSNQIQYFLPRNLGGVYGNIAYSFSGSAANEPTPGVPNDKQGRSWGARLGYQNGPLNVALGYTQWRQVIGASNAAPVAIGRDLKVANIAGSYDFKVVKFWGYYGMENVVDAPANNSRRFSTNLGVTVPVGQGLIRATLVHYDLKNSPNDSTKLSLGYGYSLSKRTQLYATAAMLRNKGAATAVVKTGDGLSPAGGTTPGGKSSGLDVGIRHVF